MSQTAAEISQLQLHSEQIPLRMHPRIFAALGADLVTNDVVAVIELVKNSYDAYARSVHVRHLNCPINGPYLEIVDDGCGMNRTTIENVWCLIATPHKEMRTTITRGVAKRRVAGEKGLGRLSAARIGKRLRMRTKASDDICWEVKVDWTKLSQGNDISGSYITCKPCHKSEKFLSSETGTQICIYGLKAKWSANEIVELQDNLARLLSPFSNVDDFNIYLTTSEGGQSTKIKTSEFLSDPKYKISGFVDNIGNIQAKYQFKPISGGAAREKNLSLSWRRISDSVRRNSQFELASGSANCGPFGFEIRAWDVAPSDTSEISERFAIQKNLIRKSIKAHHGISVYRDNVLTLPKSDSARDWLGLDLRRVSRVGKRLSTSQIVGYVSISADDNPRIEDTSDRERLVSRIEVTEFREIITHIVELLEVERDQDKRLPTKEHSIGNLFGSIDAAELVEEVNMLSEQGASASDIASSVKQFNVALMSVRSSIQERFLYYSQLATIGTIAHMLIHEIRNKTTLIGSFMQFVKDRFELLNDDEFEKKYKYADYAVDALEQLSDNFLPLASRRYRRGKRHSILEERVKVCLSFARAEIKAQNVQCRVPGSATDVAVDPGELDVILLNLISNAVYWLSDVPPDSRALTFDVGRTQSADRVQMLVRDTGPGIDDGDKEKVFWPGMTRKPNGLEWAFQWPRNWLQPTVDVWCCSTISIRERRSLLTCR